MAKIYLDEIDAVLSSFTSSSLETDSLEATKINNTLVDFVDDSRGTLIGNNWDKYRSKFSSFNEALNMRVQVAAKLGKAINDALKLLKDYMEEDVMLDSSMLDEYKRQRVICKNSISNLSAMLNETKQVEHVDSDGNVTYSRVHLYDVDEVQSQIDLANETLEELDRLIVKIEGLDAVYHQAEAILQEAYTDVQGFGGLVQDIMPDPEFTYNRVVA